MCQGYMIYRNGRKSYRCTSINGASKGSKYKQLVNYGNDAWMGMNPPKGVTEVMNNLPPVRHIQKCTRKIFYKKRMERG